MKQEKKSVNIKDNEGILISSKELKVAEITQLDLPLLYEIYKKWKSLCESLEQIQKRTTNIPEAISESSVAFLNKYCFLNQKSITHQGTKISTSFDCFDPKTGDKIQIKASSTIEDLTSFGPKSYFEKLFFVDFYDEKGRNGIFKVYEIPRENIDSFFVNANQTLSSQAEKGRRPRFSLKKLILQKNISGHKYQLTPQGIVPKDD